MPNISTALTSFSIPSATPGTKSHRDWNQASHKIPTAYHELQPTPLLAKMALTTSLASSWALRVKGSHSQHLPSISLTEPRCCSLQRTEHRQQHFWQRLDTVSLWFKYEAFLLSYFEVLSYFSPFSAGQQVCCRSGASQLSHYLRFYGMLGLHLFITGKNFKLIRHDIKSPPTHTHA